MPRRISSDTESQSEFDPSDASASASASSSGSSSEDEARKELDDLRPARKKAPPGKGRTKKPAKKWDGSELLRRRRHPQAGKGATRKGTGSSSASRRKKAVSPDSEEEGELGQTTETRGANPGSGANEDDEEPIIARPKGTKRRRVVSSEDEDDGAPTASPAFADGLPDLAGAAGAFATPPATLEEPDVNADADVGAESDAPIGRRRRRVRVIEDDDEEGATPKAPLEALASGPRTPKKATVEVPLEVRRSTRKQERTKRFDRSKGRLGSDQDESEDLPKEADDSGAAPNVGAESDVEADEDEYESSEGLPDEVLSCVCGRELAKRGYRGPTVGCMSCSREFHSVCVGFELGEDWLCRSCASGGVPGGPEEAELYADAVPFLPELEDKVLELLLRFADGQVAARTTKKAAADLAKLAARKPDLDLFCPDARRAPLSHFLCYAPADVLTPFLRLNLDMYRTDVDNVAVIQAWLIRLSELELPREEVSERFARILKSLVASRTDNEDFINLVRMRIPITASSQQHNVLSLAVSLPHGSEPLLDDLVRRLKKLDKRTRRKLTRRSYVAHAAARNQRSDAIHALVKGGLIRVQDLLKVDGAKLTPLHYAAAAAVLRPLEAGFDCLKSVAELVTGLEGHRRQSGGSFADAARSSVDVEDGTGKSPLLAAANREDKVLDNWGVDGLDLLADEAEEVPEVDATTSISVRAVKLLIDLGANPLLVDAERTTALHYAAVQWDAPLVHFLMELGIPANVVDSAGWTPLLYAFMAEAKKEDQGAGVNEDVMVALLQADSAQLAVMDEHIRDKETQDSDSESSYWRHYSRNRPSFRVPASVFHQMLRSLAEKPACYSYLNRYCREFPDALSKFARFPGLLDLENRLAYFRDLLRQQRYAPLYGPQHLVVQRGAEFTSAFAAHRDLRAGPMSVMFANEPGIMEGPLREFFSAVAVEFAKEELGVFKTADNGLAFFKEGPVADGALKRAEFAGRLCGMALYNGKTMSGVRFAAAFFKTMIGSAVACQDYEQIDPEVYQSWTRIRESDLSQNEYLNFVVSDESGNSVELVEDGENVLLSESNKEKFIERYWKWKLGRVNDLRQSFLKGFNLIVPQACVSHFQPAELELALFGMQQLDVADWKANADCSSVPTYLADAIWEAVQAMDGAERALLLAFWTGCSALPLGGFAGLRTLDGRIGMFIQVDAYTNTDRLPTSSTCFNRLVVPKYPSGAVLKEKLLIAIHYGAQGFAFS
ncbi:hypothetical protein DFJ74DRAFT_665598 [Hyaloraphidium curvatum]|nr:hypothetical protein DFJ74DRAFT_665598 [Hyaloraphidium curvatum]